MLPTPVVFLIFNRPDLTERSFETIRQVRPRALYIVADGPRPNRAGEGELCRTTRAVTERVDWPCEVIRDYSEINLGCGVRVASGITNAFQLFEEAIILEDDCLPGPSFFQFCSELLELYRHDTRVGHISGNNFQRGQRRGDGDYYFSKFSHNWGWATWRRAWRAFDFHLRDWPAFRDAGLLAAMSDSPDEEQFWRGVFDRGHTGTPDIWDAQWLFACWQSSALSILPQTNLVRNLGFREEDATHTSRGDSALANLSIGEIGRLRHPRFVVRNCEADAFTFATVFHPTPPQRPGVGKVRSLLGRVRRKLRALTQRTCTEPRTACQ